MADQWNDGIPAVGNQISADIPDIEENMGHMRSSFERIFQSWSTSNGGNASAKFASGTGFSDGTYNYEFPTNGVAASSVIMLGTSSTIIWMYLNSAPPGWKVLTTGGDTVLAISGGTGDYNVNGGNPDSAATWTVDGFSHNHKWYEFTNSADDDQCYDSSGSAISMELNSATKTQDKDHFYCDGGTTTKGPDVDLYTANAGASNDGTWRPSASVGKLFQLDTA